jgi:hypothetical protein
MRPALVAKLRQPRGFTAAHSTLVADLERNGWVRDGYAMPAGRTAMKQQVHLKPKSKNSPLPLQNYITLCGVRFAENLFIGAITTLGYVPAGAESLSLAKLLKVLPRPER